VILHRIELDILDRTCSPHIVSTVFQAAFNAASEVVVLVIELTINDRAMFWMPCELRYPYTGNNQRGYDASHNKADRQDLRYRTSSEVVTPSNQLLEYDLDTDISCKQSTRCLHVIVDKYMSGTLSPVM